jgi:hypothetical protein
MSDEIVRNANLHSGIYLVLYWFTQHMNLRSGIKMIWAVCHKSTWVLIYLVSSGALMLN